MKKDDIFIGMLCASSKGTGVVSWVDEDTKNVYMSDLGGTLHYKVDIDDIDCWVEEDILNQGTTK